MTAAVPAPVRAKNTNSEGRCAHIRNLRCKFGDHRSIFPRLNDVIIPKFSHFSVERSELQLSHSGGQTKTDVTIGNSSRSAMKRPI